ncbi:Lar family restriction alleviation protein [Candidatus Saccharibacteria bacterium]|nr:Lar family restriction alleviation protein [Candidatus Saccharibacteria bacterium]
MAELKPCPFKGCENKDIEILSDQVAFTTYKFFAYCPECGARGPREDDEQQAIDAWNRREK